jgi:hypothetical protein
VLPERKKKKKAKKEQKNGSLCDPFGVCRSVPDEMPAAAG